jgi:ferredoxin
MLGASTFKILTPDHPVALTPARCLRFRLNTSACRLCVDSCPHQAWSLSATGLELNQAKCRGCLLCLGACPTGACEGAPLGVEKKLTGLSRHPQPVLGCDSNPAPAHERLPCLGLLAHPEVLLAVAAALPQGVQLNLSRCRQCRNSAVLPALEQALTRVGALIPCPGLLAIRPVREAEDLRYQAPGISRRDFFSLVRSGSSSSAVRALDRLTPAPPDPPYRNKKIPRFRALLLRFWPQIPEAIRPRVAATCFPRVETAPTCTGCTGCVGICPTGALAPSTLAGEPPEVHPGDCTACGLCAAFCRLQAMTVTPGDASFAAG